MGTLATGKQARVANKIIVDFGRGQRRTTRVEGIERKRRRREKVRSLSRLFVMKAKITATENGFISVDTRMWEESFQSRYVQSSQNCCRNNVRNIIEVEVTSIVFQFVPGSH